MSVGDSSSSWALTQADDASRARTGQLLGELRAGRWSPADWRRFLARSARMSADAARERPRAAAEVTVLHLVFYGMLRSKAWRAGHSRVCAGRAPAATPGGCWIVTSWALSVTHLGLLGERHSLGWPNVLTLLRANLPVAWAQRPPWMGGCWGWRRSASMCWMGGSPGARLG